VQQRHIQSALVRHQQGTVIGDDFGEQAEDKQRGKDQQAGVAETVLAETPPALLIG
jgi:hypothetical protein